MDKQELERTTGTYIVVLSLIQIDTLNFHTNIEYNLSSHFCSLYSILPVSEYWFIITLINNRYIRIYIIYILGENVYPDLVGWLCLIYHDSWWLALDTHPLDTRKLQWNGFNLLAYMVIFWFYFPKSFFLRQEFDNVSNCIKTISFLRYNCKLESLLLEFKRKGSC